MSLRCKACGKDLIDFEDEGFCLDCYLAYDQKDLSDVQKEIEEILEGLDDA